MTKRNENRMTMYEGLLSLFQSHSAKVQSNSALAAGSADFTGLVQSIKVKWTELEKVSAGKVDTKNNAEEAVIAAVMPLISALNLYAQSQNDAELLALTKIGEYRLRQKRDTDLAQYCNNISDLAAAHATAMQTYDISAEKLTDLKAKAAAYTAAIGLRESSVADRKGTRGTLNELFDRADEMLNERIDRLMELVRPAEPEFYNKYFAARVVKDTGIRHRNNGDSETPQAPPQAPPTPPVQS
jgi:hypothetical protein